MKLKSYKPRKPDSVLCYHLSMLPTRKLERAALKRFLTRHCSTQGLPATYITANCCELLPHIFTLALNPSPRVEKGIERQLFSVALSLSVLKEVPKYGMGCPALSGLSFPSRLKRDKTIARICSGANL